LYSPEIDEEIRQDFQQDKLFQSCLSSPMNDVIVEFLRGVNKDEDFETTSIEISSSIQTTAMEFQESNKIGYATFQSEIQKGNEKTVVPLDPSANHDFKNASINILDFEIVHNIIFSHLKENCDRELISIHSFERQNDSPQMNFQKFNKTKLELFDEQKDNLDAHKMVFIFEYVQGCMNVSIEMHGKMEKPIAVISFENTFTIEEVEKEQKTLVRETYFSILTPKKEMCPHVFHDPMEFYIEDLCNQNLQLVVGYELRNERDEKSMEVLDMDFFIPEVSFQSELSFDSEGCYSKHFQHIFHPFDKNIQNESPENKDVLTGEIDRPSTGRVEPVRGCLITQAVWDEPP
jgi:hypothetical protein